MRHTEDLKIQLKTLVKLHVVKKFDKPVRLASGSETTEYYDGKQITLFPERAILFIKLILEELDLEKIDAVGGMSTGADPIVSAFSLLAYIEKNVKIPAFYVRKAEKAHGLSKRVEGVEIKRGMRVLVVEDVVTQGRSTLEAIRVIEAEGGVIAKVACLVDREAGGSEKISSKYPFQAIFKKSQLI